MLLDHKIALITGAGQGIGKGIVEQFVKNGAIVYANDMREGSLDSFALDMKERYDSAIVPVYFDVTDTTAVKAAIMRIKKEQGKIDVLVNNAGIMKDALIGMITQDTMRKTFDVNVFAVMEILQLSAKIMIRQNSGSIINISSIVGVYGNRGQLVYSASKGAVISLTKTAAKELAPYNIRVNAIAPGNIDTDLFRSVGEEFQKQKIDSIGMGRLGTPNDIAKACIFLGSELSEYVTGQIICVDGSAH